jgi:hypothetical protein
VDTFGQGKRPQAASVSAIYPHVTARLTEPAPDSFLALRITNNLSLSRRRNRPAQFIQ